MRNLEGRRDSILNLNYVWHHSLGFEDSNISKSSENFILVMFYALTSPYFYKKYLFSRIGHLKKIILKGRGFRCGSDEKMMRMWFGLEIDVVGLPPLLLTLYWLGYFFKYRLIPRSPPPPPFYKFPLRFEIGCDTCPWSKACS